MARRATRSAKDGGRPVPGATPRPGESEPAPALPLYVVAALVGISLLLVAGVRLRLAGVPLERDEGEYAYAGQLLLRGIPPYQLAYNMKFPGTYYAYAAILALFGESARGIRIGLMLVNAATVLPLVAIARRLLGNLGAAVAGSTFLLLTAGTTLLGLFAHATHFVLLPALAGFWLLLRANDSKRVAPLLGSGALLGVAVLMKQHAIFFLPLALAMIAASARGAAARARSTAVRSGLLLAGVALPLALVALVLARQGVLDRFWLWTFAYAREYVSRVPLSAAPGLLFDGVRGVASTNTALWCLAIPGALALFQGGLGATARRFVAGLLGVSFLAVSPGFFYRSHYFILLVPAVALLAGVSARAAARLVARRFSPGAGPAAALALFLALAISGLLQQRELFFALPPAKVSRALYGANPFPEAVEIGRWLRERTPPEERIAVLGSEPEIYFEADRRSATGYIYTYPLMEAQPFASRMQREMIREIEAAHPAYLVDVRIPVSWLRDEQSDSKILEWRDRYSKRCYDVVGRVEILSADRTRYLWDEDAVLEPPASDQPILVLRRKSSEPCAVGASG